jgi:hypothetical protein
MIDIYIQCVYVDRLTTNEWLSTGTQICNFVKGVCVFMWFSFVYVCVSVGHMVYIYIYIYIYSNKNRFN